MAVLDFLLRSRAAREWRWLPFLQNLATCLLICGLPCCSERCYCVDSERVSSSYHIQVESQDLYPTGPWDLGGYCPRENPCWDTAFALASDPGSFSGISYESILIVLDEPYCQKHPEVTARCAEVEGRITFVGPKRKGEIYQALHEPENSSDIDPAIPAIYASWREGPALGGEFPEYHSETVSGSFEVEAESPFTVAFDLEFQDANGQRRQVTGKVTSEYRYSCVPP